MVRMYGVEGVPPRKWSSTHVSALMEPDKRFLSTKASVDIAFLFLYFKNIF
jgi:hypothetical protein